MDEKQQQSRKKNGFALESVIDGMELIHVLYDMFTCVGPKYLLNTHMRL